MQAVNHSTRLPRPSSTLLRIGQVASQLGVTTQTIRNWIKQGELDCVRTAGGQRLITEASVRRYLGFDEEEEGTEATPVFLVARTSTNRQAKGHSKGETDSDLARQIERLREYAKDNYPDSTPVEFVSVRSGLNFNDQGFVKVVDAILSGQCRGGVVICTHRDRIMRMAYEVFQLICRQGGCEVVEIEETDESEKSYGETLAEDLLAFTHVYSCRHYAKRSAQTNMKHVSDECVTRMIELRQEGFPIDQITRTLNREGFKQQKKGGAPERVTERIVLRYLDSNGIQKALEVAVGVGNEKKRPIEEFLATRLVRTGKKEDRALNKDIRAAYVKWAKGKKVEIETPTNLGKLIVGMGFERGKDGKGNRYYLGVKLAG